MHKRKLGPDGPLVSAVGIGAMSFAGFYGPTTEAEAHALLASAPDMGIDHLDTSNVYGMGLSALCALLRPGPLLGIVISGVALSCFIRALALAPSSERPMSRRRATRSYVRE